MQETRPVSSALAFARAEEVLDAYSNLVMMCPACNVEWRAPAPVNLTSPQCPKCAGRLDPICWQGGKPVNHRLMQRLISTCYLHPAFARQIVDLYRRDPDHAQPDEIGIDKALLGVHAIHSLAQKGHKSWVLVLLAGAVAAAGAFFPPIALLVTIPLFVLMSGYRNQNDRYWEKSAQSTAYNPSNIEKKHLERINKGLQHLDTRTPTNLVFFSGYNPFYLTGGDPETWSFLVDRRKLTGGDRTPDARELDLDETRRRILERLRNLPGFTTAAGRFRIEDVAFVSGANLDRDDTAFLDKGDYPRYEIDAGSLEQIRTNDDPRFRVFTRLTYYNPCRDVAVISYFRLHNLGQFTLIEAVSNRILPLIEQLFGKFRYRLTQAELKERMGKQGGLWTKLSFSTRRRAGFTLSLFVFTAFVFGFLATLPAGATIDAIGARPLEVAGLVAGLITFAAAIATYGRMPKWKDVFEPWMDIPFPFSMVLAARGRSARFWAVRQ